MRACRFKDGFNNGGGSITAENAAEDAEVVPKAPPPPTDTPAGDLALAAKQVQAEQAAGDSTGPVAAGQEPSVAASSADGESQAAQQEQWPGEEGPKKRQPRVVAT
jgi:hypothetical protein